MRPKIFNPQYDVVVPILKTISAEKEAHCQIVVDKDWFYAGDVIQLKVDVDNSKCDTACNLEVTHVAYITMQPTGKSYTITVKKDKYFVAYKNQQKA